LSNSSLDTAPGTTTFLSSLFEGPSTTGRDNFFTRVGEILRLAMLWRSTTPGEVILNDYVVRAYGAREAERA
jgi:hypothetical protein